MSRVDGSPAISVIMPVLNASTYFKEALDSLQSQTFADWELVCVDNGSTDNSLPLLQECANHDARIKILREQTRGAWAARNTGLENCRGRFIAFLDADDSLPDEEALHDLYASAELNRTSIAGGSLRLIRPNGIRDFEFADRDQKMVFRSDGSVEYQDYQFDYGYWRFIYNQQFLRDNNLRFPANLFFEDEPFFVRAMLAAGRFWALKRPTYQYRIDHKPLRWTNEKLVGLLTGLADNLSLSREHGLTLLHNLTVERLTIEYEGAIRGGRYLGSAAVLRAEARCLSSINRSVLHEREKQLVEKYHRQRMRSTLWRCLRQPHSIPRRFLTYWQGRRRMPPRQ